MVIAMNSFTFYSNYFEIIKYLKNDDRLAMYDAILSYMFENKEPEFTGLKKGIWINIKMPLDTSKTNYNNGKKGGRPKANNKPKENPKKTETITEKKPKAKANNISIFLFLISNNKYKYIIKDNNIYKSIYKWLSYKEERKEFYKETGLNSLLTQIENQITIHGEETIINLIEECMANNYKGIIFDKLKNKKQESIVPEWMNEERKEKEMTNEQKRILERIRGNNNKS